MLHIPKIDDYLEILTDKEVKDFVAKNFSEYFKSIREEQNLRNNEVEKCKQSNSSDNCIHTVRLRFLIFLIQNYN